MKTILLLLTYRWHNHLSLKTSSDTIINTLRLAPAGIEAFVGITLMSVETLDACLFQYQHMPM